eukprot:992780-Pyramimonas_sp.AAC.1
MFSRPSAASPLTLMVVVSMALTNSKSSTSWPMLTANSMAFARFLAGPAVATGPRGASLT